LNLAAQITFDLVVAVDGFADLHHFGVGKLVDATIGGMPTFSTISAANFAPMP
jgi:predicted HAD superfamily Cof-like phosphohydrolase